MGDGDYNKGESTADGSNTTSPSIMMGDNAEDPNNETYVDDGDDEIIMDHKAPLCTRNRMRWVTWGSLTIALVCLCIVLPIVVVNSNKSSSSKQQAYLGNTWIKLGDTFVDELSTNNDFGESVALSGDGLRIAIGANRENDKTGKVVVKKFQGSFWKNMGDAISGPEAGLNFGHVVQLSQDGNILVASGFGTSDGKGIVQSYRYSESTDSWNQFGGDVRSPNIGDRFGVSLSLSAKGDAFVVGGDGSNSDIPRNGTARVYALNSVGSWIRKGRAFFGKDGSRMGYAVAMSGDGETICIGERDYKLEVSGNKRGKVQCFYWQESEWIPRGDRIRGTYDGGNFGYSLSLNHRGDRLAVGNREAGDGNEGSVTVFHNHKGKWERMGEEMLSGNGDDHGGFQVALNHQGDVLSWTARGHDTKEKKNVGIVRVAQWRDNKWQELGEGISGVTESDYFGESVAMNDKGDIIAASSNWNFNREYVTAYRVT